MTRAQLSQVWSAPSRHLAIDAQRLAEAQQARSGSAWLVLVIVAVAVACWVVP